MQAYVLHGIDDLRYEQADMPELKPGWVIVKVMAAGICGSDILRIFERRRCSNRWQLRCMQSDNFR